ncbi:MAG: DUF799 domain-containing protein [Comamonas sp.]
MKWLSQLASVVAIALLATGCATTTPYDYSAYKQHRPRSIVVLPPLNASPEVDAPAAVLSQVTMPLAESGYYVLPVAVVDEVFKQNGLATAADAHAVDPPKLREIFGADAALYLNIKQYGSVYTVLQSAAVVTLEAKLVDLKTSTVLWTGQASASSAEQQSSGGGGLIGLLVVALVNQVLNTVTDRSYGVAGIADQRLLTAGNANGLLYGHRSPKAGTN